MGGNLLALFANGENGFLFGPYDDFTRLLTTSTGLVNVAANDDPVGLNLDRHSWGGQTLAQVLSAQSELVPNQGLTGGTVGVLGSGGATPTGITMQSGTGLAREVVALSSDANGSYQSLKISGTVSGGSTVFPGIQLSPGNTSGIPATTALSHQVKLRAALIAGSLTGFTVCTFAVNEYSAAGSYLTTVNVVASIALTGAYQEITGIYTPSNASCAFIQPILSMSVANGVTVNATFQLWAASAKRVPGNHALQGTTTKRPLWKANSGKPYLNFDGGDDNLGTGFLPTAAVTLAVALRASTTGASQIAIGGGATTGSKRCFIGLNTNGKLNAGWGSETIGTNDLGADITGADHVVVLTGDAVSRDIWLDGALLDSRAPAGGTGPDGTGNGVVVGAVNTSGAVGSNMTGRIGAALALNRRATPPEIALITSQFQRTYQ